MLRAQSQCFLAMLVLAGCGSSEGESAITKGMPPPTKNIAELKQAQPTNMSPEELAEARKKAGFKSRDELAQENAAEFEKAAKEYVKAHAKQYKTLLGDLRKALDDLEKEAPKWPDAKDPQKAFDKFATKYGDRVKELTKKYDEVTAMGAEGGNTQAIFGKAFRSFSDLASGLTPDVGKAEGFSTTVADIRKGYEEVEKAVGEIEKDPSVGTGAEGKTAEADADAAKKDAKAAKPG